MKIKLLILFLSFTTFTNAQYSKLLDFDGANGKNPWYGSLISDGVFLYGMTYEGGTNNVGVIYKIKTDGSGYVCLHNFGSSTDGSKPYASLISDGTFLYGMTHGGGTNGAGSIFKINPDGTGYVKLFDFGASANASSPCGSLFFDGVFLYGMASGGGSVNAGVIFKIKTDGTGYVKLLDFIGSNGAAPIGSFISDGVFLYGMTSSGGSNGWGTIFKIKPDGTGYVKILDFGGIAHAQYPYGSLIYDGTFLYGTATEGANTAFGAIFKIRPDGTGFTNLHDFIIGTDGVLPLGSLISFGGLFYGMTKYGGTSTNCGMDGCGTIFKIKSDGTGYSTILSFANDSIQGNDPYGTLFSDGNCLYGMTYGGGLFNMGTIFKINPIGIGITEYNEEIDFTIYPNPFSSQTNLEIDKNIKDATLTVYNSFGQQVKQIKNINSQKINLYRDNLPNGQYFLRLIQDNKILLTNKIVITDK